VAVQILGSGGPRANTDRASASYLLWVGGRARILIDAGGGASARFGASGANHDDLALIAISHLHPDHYIDLVPLRHYLRYEHEPPRRVRVLGPAGLADRLDALHDEPGFSAQALDTEVLGTGERVIGSLRLRAGLVRHTAESYAMRVAPAGGGPGLVYSGDCGRAADLGPLIEPGDTLLTEVSFGPGPIPDGVAHLDGPSVAGIAGSSGVGRVLLTHLQMGFDPDETEASVRAGYDGPVSFVWPGSVLDL
jgi:ribonuclease BN (tRNA processing enzyme)